MTKRVFILCPQSQQAFVTRFKKFQQSLLTTKEEIVVADIDTRTYAKYVLQEGKDFEKRELPGCLREKIKLKNKVVTIE